MKERICSPASAAKSRKQGPLVQKQRAQGGSSGAQKRKVTAKPVAQKATARKAKVTGGKSKKTGMVLARAQLRTTAGVLATSDRQNAMLAKKYREAEKLGGTGGACDRCTRASQHSICTRGLEHSCTAAPCSRADAATRGTV
jgi:hypothetical protein